MTDTNKLLIAAKVHEIATSKRDTARRVAAAVTARNRRTFAEWEWNDQNPLQNFVPEAINELQAIEAIIWPPVQ